MSGLSASSRRNTIFRKLPYPMLTSLMGPLRSSSLKINSLSYGFSRLLRVALFDALEIHTQVITGNQYVELKDVEAFLLKSAHELRSFTIQGLRG